MGGHVEKIDWIKDLVKAEQQMEESGLIDMSYGFDKERLLAQETLQYLLLLKTEFVDSTSAFNELKTSPLGRVKVYGIAKTHADFMLFRNGFKMIFSLKAPGQISIRFNFMGTNFIPGATEAMGGGRLVDEKLLEAKWGAFDELIWTYQGAPYKTESLVRSCTTHFLRESSK